MMARGAEKAGVARDAAASGYEAADLEHFQRLVELQSQIVAIARQNAEAERQCVALRKRLDREARSLFWSRPLLGSRWRAALAAAIERWRRREMFAVALKWLS